MNDRGTFLKELNITFVKIGRGAQAYEIAQNEAQIISTFVIFVQGPYIHSDRTRRITKYYPSFEIFSPIDNWLISRRRVISYVGEGAGFRSL